MPNFREKYNEAVESFFSHNPKKFTGEEVS